jgi:hypothetical protein
MFLGFSYTNRNVTQELSAERYRTREIIREKNAGTINNGYQGPDQGGKEEGKD